MKTFCAVCAFALSATAVTAQETGSTSIGFGFSSLGANLEAQYKVKGTVALTSCGRNKADTPLFQAASPNTSWTKAISPWMPGFIS